jgi:hypothetical protein
VSERRFLAVQRFVAAISAAINNSTNIDGLCDAGAPFRGQREEAVKEKLINFISILVGKKL